MKNLIYKKINLILRKKYINIFHISFVFYITIIITTSIFVLFLV